MGRVVAFHRTQRIAQSEAFDGHRLKLDGIALCRTAAQRVVALAVAHGLQAAALQQCGKTVVDAVLTAQPVRFRPCSKLPSTDSSTPASPAKRLSALDSGPAGMS